MSGSPHSRSSGPPRGRRWRRGALVAQVEQARRRMRVFAVESYVAGGPISEMTYLIDAPTAEDFAWRQHMVRTSFDTTRDAATAYDELRDEVDDHLVELAVTAD